MEPVTKKPRYFENVQQVLSYISQMRDVDVKIWEYVLYNCSLRLANELASKFKLANQLIQTSEALWYHYFKNTFPLIFGEIGDALPNWVPNVTPRWKSYFYYTLYFYRSMVRVLFRDSEYNAEYAMQELYNRDAEEYHYYTPSLVYNECKFSFRLFQGNRDFLLEELNAKVTSGTREFPGLQFHATGTLKWFISRHAQHMTLMQENDLFSVEVDLSGFSLSLIANELLYPEAVFNNVSSYYFYSYLVWYYKTVDRTVAERYIVDCFNREKVPNVEVWLDRRVTEVIEHKDYIIIEEVVQELGVLPTTEDGQIDIGAPVDFCTLCSLVSNSVCQQCQQTVYCSETCQKKDWPVHQRHCK